MILLCAPNTSLMFAILLWNRKKNDKEITLIAHNCSNCHFWGKAQGQNEKWCEKRCTPSTPEAIAVVAIRMEMGNIN